MGVSSLGVSSPRMTRMMTRPDAAVVEVVQVEEPPSEQPDELREEFLKVLGEVRKGGEGKKSSLPGD